MANIFSGIFSNQGGGANDAMALAKYKDDLEQEKLLREYQQRNQTLIDTSNQYDKSIANMDPERQARMNLFRQFAGSEQMSDKGMEMMSSGFKQRDLTLGDIKSQAEKRKTHESNRLFDIANPEAPTTPSKVLSRQHFIEQWKADPRNDQKLIDQRGYGATNAELSRMSDRSEQFLDLGDQKVSTTTGQIIQDRMLQTGIKAEAAANYAPRLVNFQASVDDSEDLLNFTENRLDDIRQLSEQTDGWTTGRIGLLLQTIDPGSDAADWERLKETIVSNIGLDKIMSLKAGSAQGATGLGALNEKELEMLQNHAGNLAAAQSPEQIKKVLRRLERDLKRSQNRVMQALPRELSFYNQYQQYLPDRDQNTPRYVPSEYQQSLFEGGQYKRADTPGTVLDTPQGFSIVD